jgi:hypothetical protein
MPRPPRYPKFPATLQGSDAIRPPEPESVSAATRRAKEALADEEIRKLLLGSRQEVPVTGQYYDVIRATQQVRTGAPPALTNQFVRGIFNKAGGVHSFAAANYSYPSGQMVIGAALAGLGNVTARTGFTATQLGMMSPKMAPTVLSPLDAQYIPAVQAVEKKKMGEAFLKAAASRFSPSPSADRAVAMARLMGLGAAGSTSQSELDAKAAAAQAELRAAASNPAQGASVAGAIQNAAGATVAAQAAQAAPPASSSFGQFASAAGGPLTAFLGNLGTELGKAVGEIAKELAKQALVAAKCGVNGYHFCDAEGAMNAVMGHLAANWGGGSAAAVKYFFMPQDRTLINKYKICDDDGEAYLNCSDWSTSKYSGDGANESNDFIRNWGALEARTKECLANKQLRESLGILTPEEYAAVKRYAMLQAALTWIAAQTTDLALDPAVIQQDPNFRALMPDQQQLIISKVQEKKAALTGILPTSRGGKWALILGTVAVVGGAVYWFKFRKPA